VYGVQELWQTIFDLKEKKKITSVVNPVAASAAYWIASASSEIVVTPSGEVGSIGVYLMHVDVSSAMTSAGRKVTLVKAGERKASGHPYAPLDPTALDELQSGVNDYYDKFVRAVAKGRKTTQTAVRDGFGRGGMVRAEAAVKEGVSVSDIRSEEIKENTENQDIEIRKRKMKMMDIA
jgi:ClpP class serine protease